jgi:DNA-binding protein
MSEKTATVLIGKKPLMNYVLACFTAIQSGTNELTIKARGKAISRAVDVVQILQRRFFNDLQVKDIKIGTEQLTGENNVTVNVSTIEINVTRKK